MALAALGMLSTLATGLTVDGFGPVSDNAGGIAEMSGMEEEVLEEALSERRQRRRPRARFWGGGGGSSIPSLEHPTWIIFSLFVNGVYKRYLTNKNETATSC